MALRSHTKPRQRPSPSNRRSVLAVCRTAQYHTAIIPGEDATGDVLGPFPETSDGVKYLFVLIDRASRWMEAEPMKQNTAEDLLSALLRMILALEVLPHLLH